MAETRVYMDLSRLCLTTFTSGIQRVAKEIVLRLLREPSISLTLLADLPTHTACRVLPQEAFIRYYTEKEGSPYGTGKPQIIRPEDIPTAEILSLLQKAGTIREMTVQPQNIDHLIAAMYQELEL